MKTSDHGIHAASLGGIWQIMVCGFGGVRMAGGKLRISPNLPEDVDQIQFRIHWKGNLLTVTASKHSLRIENGTEQSEVILDVHDKAYKFTDALSIDF